MLMLVFIRDLGSSLMYFGAFLALLYVATNRLSFVVVGLRAVRRSARGSSPRTSAHVHDRVDIWLDPFDPALYDKARRPTRSRSRCSRRPTAGCSAPASARRC